MSTPAIPRFRISNTRYKVFVLDCQTQKQVGFFPLMLFELCIEHARVMPDRQLFFLLFSRTSEHSLSNFGNSSWCSFNRSRANSYASVSQMASIGIASSAVADPSSSLCSSCISSPVAHESWRPFVNWTHYTLMRDPRTWRQRKNWFEENLKKAAELSDRR
jgi:hypothetical protein